MRSILRKIKTILFLRCDAASLLTSRSLDERLEPHEKAALEGHRLICPRCRRLRSQFVLIGEVLRSPTEPGEAPSGAALGPEAKTRIVRLLETSRIDDAKGEEEIPPE